ncbi:hypothetical protein ABWL39_06435 [Chitinivorax sp. PXF-14]|uniref:hypothetical protein n=1 Tax=Chitinivorax sp. PXF-14 TaxID=3230488 RepID=UPI0034657F78
MARYFEGRRQVATFSHLLTDERAKVDCRIFEEWVDIDNSTTVHCGAEGQCTVEREIGLSEKATYTLKGAIESTIGIKDVLSIKSQVEESIGHEVNWSSAVRTSKTFPYRAPKCGRYTLTIYQLVRIYELTYSRKRWIAWQGEAWSQRWLRTFREGTNNHDALPDVEQFDDGCKCASPPEHAPSADGVLVVDFGHISVRAPYRLTDDGFEVQLVDKVIAYSFTEYASIMRGLDNGLDTVLPTDLIPAPLRFLGGVHEAELEARIQRIVMEEVGTARPLEGVLIGAAAVGQLLVPQVQKPEPLEG